MWETQLNLAEIVRWQFGKKYDGSEVRHTERGDEKYGERVGPGGVPPCAITEDLVYRGPFAGWDDPAPVALVVRSIPEKTQSGVAGPPRTPVSSVDDVQRGHQEPDQLFQAVVTAE